MIREALKKSYIGLNKEFRFRGEEPGRLEEERRLCYVGITRAQRSLLVSHCRQRKKGREMVATAPSRFIADMTPAVGAIKEDPREKLKALRAEFAHKAALAAAQDQGT